MRRPIGWTRIAAALAGAVFGLAPVATLHADGLSLRPVKPGPVHVGVRQPFTVDLVAERGDAAQISAIAYTIEVPSGVVCVGEELLVESLLGVGSSREGMNLVFECTDKTPLPVLRFRFVAMRPLTDAVIRLRPDRRTRFLGLITCREQDFSKVESKPDSVVVATRW
jgi:hypothetical protein